jgi:hypothetical protein
MRIWPRAMRSIRYARARRNSASSAITWRDCDEARRRPCAAPAHGADIALLRRERIIAAIVKQLRPHKHDVDEVTMRADIRVNVEKIVPRVAAIRSLTASTRKKAARAAKALAALEQDIPAFAGFDFGIVRTVLEGIAFGTGPDPRFSYLNWICEHQARALVAKYSPRRPVTTRAGNVHQMAQLLCEAVTGTQGTEAGLLKAVKRSKK